MADTTRTVEIRALYDNTRLKAGTEEAERSIETLAREVETSSDDIRRSLQSMDDGVSSTLGPSGTLDTSTDVAGDSMRDMASTAREEVPAAMLDMRDGVTGAAEGIAQAMATLGPGGTVVATAIAGFVILKGRAEATAQAMRDQINTALSSIEVKAKTTNAAIERMYEKQLTFQQTLERMGDGDATKGYEKLAGYATTLGVETEDVVAFIQGRQTPAAERVAEILARQGDILAGQGEKLRDNYGVLTDQQTAAGALNRLAAEERDVRDRTLAIAKDSRDYLQDNKDATDKAADAAERQADASERTAAATKEAAENAERLAAAYARGRDAAMDWVFD